MSPTDTDTTGTSGEDRVLRLLDDEGVRWRAGYQPPSLDDAVRRLALPGDEGARLEDPHPLAAGPGPRPRRRQAFLVAAAVLVLVGGVVGVVSTALHRTRSAADAPVGSLDAPRLTGLPSGFVERSGPDPADPSDPAPPTGPGASLRDPVPTVSRTWERSPSGSSRPRGERLTLALYDGTLPAAGVPYEVAVVRGRLALVDAVALTSLPGVLQASVRWAEDDDHWVQVTYEDAAVTGSGPDHLDVADVVALARTYEDGPVATPSGTASGRAGSAALADVPDRFLPLDPDGLRLWQRAGVTRVTPSADGRSLAVTLPAAPRSVPTYCSPLAVAVLSGSTATTVTVDVGLYVRQLPTGLHPCPAQILSTRVQEIDLGGPLAGRAVVDGETGRVLVPAR